MVDEITITKNGIIMLCPICGHDCTHLKSVELYNARSGEDRMSAILNFDCENGHDFKIDVKQHEGMTILQEKK